MDLKLMFFEQQSQLIYQFFSVPIALLYYSLARQGCLSLTSRYMFLMLGGCVLALVAMGPYCWLVFLPALVSAWLLPSASPQHVHTWAFGAQMCWQSLWHLFIQYTEYCRQELVDHRLLQAVSSLMLLTQRVTSVSLDLLEGELAPGLQTTPTQDRTTPAQDRATPTQDRATPTQDRTTPTQDRTTPTLARTTPMQDRTTPTLARTMPRLRFLSYVLYFPALLGGPLCSFRQFVSFVEGSALSPAPAPLRPVCWKACRVLGLQGVRYLLVGELERQSRGGGGVRGFLWVWGLSLALRLGYYSHWVASEGLSNAAGLGYRGPRWDGLSDGDPWALETSSRLSALTRCWNRSTAGWLRRLVHRRSRSVPLLATFAFSAWWHGLHPGAALGFLLWGAAVKAERWVHRRVLPLLTTPARRALYAALGWAHTQLVMACVVLAVELRSSWLMWLCCRTFISVLPLLYIILLLFCYKNTA